MRRSNEGLKKPPIDHVGGLNLAGQCSMTPKIRRWASLSEAADYLGTSERSIRRYVSAGRLRGYRVGPRLIKLDLNEVDALLAPIPTTQG